MVQTNTIEWLDSLRLYQHVTTLYSLEYNFLNVQSVRSIHIQLHSAYLSLYKIKGVCPKPLNSTLFIKYLSNSISLSL
jgi:hypothetical protein